MTSGANAVGEMGQYLWVSRWERFKQGSVVA